MFKVLFILPDYECVSDLLISQHYKSDKLIDLKLCDEGHL